MKKNEKKQRKLSIHSETLRTLTAEELTRPAGGFTSAKTLNRTCTYESLWVVCTK
jgi:hypothetical protein